MKRKLFLSLLLLVSLVNAQNYTFTSFTENYNALINPISLNNGQLWDDPEFNIILPYNINVNGVVFNTIIVSDSYIYNDTTSDIKQIVSPFGNDLIDRGDNVGNSLSPLSYIIEGSVGNRITKIEFNNCGSYTDNNLSMYVNFQIWIYETSNVIEFRYGNSSITDSSIFYDGLTGGSTGITSIDFSTDDLSNVHLLSGNASNPTLTYANTIEFINGTPAANTVYRFTPTSSLNTNSFDKNFVDLFPNPVKETLYFTAKEATHISSVEIYNMLGQIILSVPNTITSIDVSELEKGNYFLKVNTEKGSTTTKFVKE
ncbi:conserved exported hypothetical protein [Flavobacterium sp. 9AF]|uniref:T9SS type A sorting domain-containing protein n=1 Tax=Flavobacterium sp. 9AF TaxID=2653142 RepID=UPI0012F4183C|nr:T9SS type A sorting domain-containing protein [Flavobacterium sp. 9AF]VXC33367.1 conserved exported hypothetical protein [Flavobacterium sp. 9AF]